ncbi:MAG: cryptochrome/photolyase family protein [Parvularcula sp.]
MPATTLLWLRNDLRFDDNPAMDHAARQGGAVAFLFVLDEINAGPFGMGTASKWWLYNSLLKFSAELEQRGGRLVLRRGNAIDIVPEIARFVGADLVTWNRRYDPWDTQTDRTIKSGLIEEGIKVRTFNAGLLNEPWDIKTGSGGQYRVYTPYWKKVWDQEHIRSPLCPVQTVSGPAKLPCSDRLEEWSLLPTGYNWATGLEKEWTPGEAGARIRWRDWLGTKAYGYHTARDRPDLDETSRLSPHIHFGEISPIRLWHEMKSMMNTDAETQSGGKKFLSELAWREFSTQLVFYNPSMIDSPLNRKFDNFSWERDPIHLTAWKKGQTGFPIVDAGMRQLWQEGWMHNRVRMIVSSFLIKDLLIDWRLGMKWFWDTLVDADCGNNTASWQWIAGCGADAAPFFRIFNPITQGKKFDPNGDYVRRYVPELSELPTQYIHTPWAAPNEICEAANVDIGKTYPRPIIDHVERRKLALERYAAIR